MIPLVVSSEFPAHYDDYVNDFAKIFSVNETQSLRAELNQVRQDTTAEFVVVTLNNLSGYTSQEYATKLFNEWGIGKADKDNGLLVLYALSENKIWVTTGYGVEGILPDSKIGRMLDEYYVPLRDDGKAKEGIISVTEALSNVLEENADEIKSGQASGSGGSPIIFFIVTILFFIFIGFLIFKNKSKTRNLKSNKINTDKSKKKGKYGVYINILSVILLIAYFISGMIIFLIIAILFIIFLRIFGRNPTSPWFVPVGHGFSGGGGFGGGGFGGGMSGGGGAGR